VGQEVRAPPRSLYRRSSFAAPVRALVAGLGPRGFQPATKRVWAASTCSTHRRFEAWIRTGVVVEEGGRWCEDHLASGNGARELIGPSKRSTEKPNGPGLIDATVDASLVGCRTHINWDRHEPIPEALSPFRKAGSKNDNPSLVVTLPSPHSCQDWRCPTYVNRFSIRSRPRNFARHQTILGVAITIQSFEHNLFRGRD
jgi:hypothetical protein